MTTEQRAALSNSELARRAKLIEAADIRLRN